MPYPLRLLRRAKASSAYSAFRFVRPFLQEDRRSSLLSYNKQSRQAPFSLVSFQHTKPHCFAHYSIRPSAACHACCGSKVIHHIRSLCIFISLSQHIASTHSSLRSCFDQPIKIQPLILLGSPASIVQATACHRF